MAGCFGIGGVSFSRCLQATTSRQKQRVFQTFLKQIGSIRKGLDRIEHAVTVRREKKSNKTDTKG